MYCTSIYYPPLLNGFQFSLTSHQPVFRSCRNVQAAWNCRPGLTLCHSSIHLPEAKGETDCCEVLYFVFVFSSRKRKKRKKLAKKRLLEETPQLMRTRKIPKVKRRRQKRRIFPIQADLMTRKRPNKRACPPVSTSLSV